MVTNNKWNLEDEPQDYKIPQQDFITKKKKSFVLEDYQGVLKIISL
ncbi:MAG: hypothetical protein IPG09_13245 [Ignavibacteria bacterium]|nr:hypothetical protein [Ignavibacteria bacterium]MBK6774131.1 hypothetical protein [Ignavibacteria bacterium]